VKTKTKADGKKPAQKPKAKAADSELDEKQLNSARGGIVNKLR